jgi:HAD superfamily hydrolase (TIGR01549 family)
MGKIKLIIFDLDGTLVDAYRAITKSLNFTMRKLHKPEQSDTVIRRAVGWGDENLLKPFVKPKDFKEALFIYRKHHKQALSKYSSLLPNAKETLVYLRRLNYKLAVASNRPTEFSKIIIRRLKLNKYLDFLLCADKLRHAKPHPEIINKIMQRFRVSPAEALYVGDMVIDAQAARRAKVKAVLVTTGSSTKNELQKEKPYKIIRNLCELRKLV